MQPVADFGAQAAILHAESQGGPTSAAAVDGGDGERFQTHGFQPGDRPIGRFQDTAVEVMD